MLSGINPDIARQDLYDTIECGQKVQYDLYVQILEMSCIDDFDFDVLDATKVWPEDRIPLIKVGRMTLIEIRITSLKKQIKWHFHQLI